jgi:hypothetical protein
VDVGCVLLQEKVRGREVLECLMLMFVSFFFITRIKQRVNFSS